MWLSLEAFYDITHCTLKLFMITHLSHVNNNELAELSDSHLELLTEI